MTKPAKKPAKPSLPSFGRTDHGAPVAHLVAENSLSRSGGAFEQAMTQRHKGARLAQVAGARASDASALRPVDGDANGRCQRVTLHPVEQMALRGMLTSWQAKAGMRLVLAFETTQRSPVAGVVAERVDGSPKPDARTTLQIEAMDRYVRLRRALPDESRDVVDHVCCKGLTLRQGLARNGREMAVRLEQLRIALDCLASHLGLI